MENKDIHKQIELSEILNGSEEYPLSRQELDDLGKRYGIALFFFDYDHDGDKDAVMLGKNLSPYYFENINNQFIYRSLSYLHKRLMI